MELRVLRYFFSCSQRGNHFCCCRGETDAMRILVRAAHQLQGAHPHVTYQLFSGNAEDVTEKLDRGLLDFGVFIEPVDLSKYDFIRLPVKDIWGLLMRKDSPLAARKTIQPEDLGLPLLCSNQAMVKNEISGWFDMAGREKCRKQAVVDSYKTYIPRCFIY